MRPMFSIVMPIYNQEKYIEVAIESILKQSIKDFELILVNDASTDSTLSICKKYVDNDLVKLIDLNENKGVSNARNCGLYKARGEYILFLDPDDTYDSNLLDIYLYSIQLRHPDLIIIGAIEEYYKKNGQLEYEKRVIPNNGFFDTQRSIYSEVLNLESKTLYGYPWNKCYRTELLKTHNLQFKNIKMIEDIDFNLQVLSYITSLDVLAKTPYHYSIRQNMSLTHHKLDNYFDLHTQRINLFLTEYKTKCPSLFAECEEVMASIYCRYLLSAIERFDGQNINNWLSSIYESKLYQTLKPFMIFKGKKRIIFYPIIKQNVILSIFLGKSVGFVKREFPIIFAKAKQLR
ncbi:hypothetical protein BO225_09595 [Dubosiella newyorkensis]|jgi:glycosyltransferase involved in cell wall biosynthesis|uniref:Glycosyltransferase 2-like domain-containing protein n=2 Tax=Dubosiella newyorkensis TaxID=1862672 RepID=A0A1U7NKN3_9FIRM|nr:hypothetical protein BO225_09595 [Dubosiella newyorkensis]